MKNRNSSMTENPKKIQKIHDHPLNQSLSKALYSFSKANRF